MTSDAANVIVLRERKQAPPLHSALFTMDPESCAIEITCTDDAGTPIAIFAYDLAHVFPKDFDLDLLREAWDRWRGSVAAAS